MAIKLGQSGLVYSDASTQTTKYDSSLDRGKVLRVDYFTSSGTWTKPAGCRKILVQIIGGGGGACGHCESGGAGGFAEKLIDVTSVTSVEVTIGGAGDGRGYHQGCGGGGTTSFGSYCSASGGNGANTWGSHTGGHGGVGSGGDVNLHGGGGRSHGDQGQAKGGEGYFGGASVSGHHGNNFYSHYSEGLNHNPPGTGGSGEWTSHSRGAHGTSGACVVYNYA